MKDGTSFVAKFNDSKSGRIMFFDHEDVLTRDMQAFNIFRNDRVQGKQEGFIELHHVVLILCVVWIIVVIAGYMYGGSQ